MESPSAIQFNIRVARRPRRRAARAAASPPQPMQIKFTAAAPSGVMARFPCMLPFLLSLLGWLIRRTPERSCNSFTVALGEALLWGRRTRRGSLSNLHPFSGKIRGMARPDWSGLVPGGLIERPALLGDPALKRKRGLAASIAAPRSRVAATARSGAPRRVGDACTCSLEVKNVAAALCQCLWRNSDHLPARSTTRRADQYVKRTRSASDEGSLRAGMVLAESLRILRARAVSASCSIKTPGCRATFTTMCGRVWLDHRKPGLLAAKFSRRAAHLLPRAAGFGGSTRIRSDRSRWDPRRARRGAEYMALNRAPRSLTWAARGCGRQSGCRHRIRRRAGSVWNPARPA